MKLYELTSNYKNLQELLNNPDLPQEEIQAALQGLDGEIEVKVEGICKVIKNLGSDVDAIDAEIKRLTAKKKTLNKQVDNLKSYMFDSMKFINTRKVSTSLFNVTIAKNPASVKLIDEDKIPAEFKEEVVTVKIDKTAIKNKLKANEVVEGVELVQGESLRIK